jgi:hypothetical protein
MTTRDLSGSTIEVQVTEDPRDHVLTNINAWSPDGRRIVFDVRPGEEFVGDEIAEVDVETKGIRSLFFARHGAHCGVVTYSPRQSLVAFILGPEHPSDDWRYGLTRRRGVLVDCEKPGTILPLDAMNYSKPFTPGALRGGSHVHVFSPDGEWISFTYEDDVLALLRPEDGDRDYNLRNVAVAVPSGPVRVARSHPRNHDGTYFSVVVTRTSKDPVPGSDEIDRAFEEGWVGDRGYVRRDGTRQRKALAFQGQVTSPQGRKHAEVYLVDIPDDPTLPGDSPLEGTERRFPAPPRGTVQRRLTFTSDRRFPGVAAAPRHWLRSSPDGSRIGFLMKDDDGIVQLWSISPNGGEPVQIARNPWSVGSTFTWSPDGRWIGHIMDNSVFVTEAATGSSYRLTARSDASAAPMPFACVFSPDGRRIAYTRRVAAGAKCYSQIFVASIPPL